jgi:hypothetical protein
MTYLVHLDRETKALAWATVVSLLGLPADQRWGGYVILGKPINRSSRRPETAWSGGHGRPCSPFLTERWRAVDSTAPRNHAV